MTIRWPARFVALMAAVSAVLLTTMPEADAARRARRQSTQIQSNMVPMVFFVAKGEPNACGPGCDTWISAEGNFDEGAAQRFDRFMAGLPGRDLPIFFYSRGGITKQSLLIGESIRDRRLSTSVGRTLPIECRRKSKVSCDALKSRGVELRSQLRTNVMCASACVYAFIGGARRKVPADASLMVHAAKAFAPVTAAQLAAHDAAVDQYVARTGVTLELVKLARSVPNERIRTLTRKEIARFGIERSERPMLWEATAGTRSGQQPQARVRSSRKAWSGSGDIDVELRLRCSNSAVEIVYNGYGKQPDEPASSDVSLMVDARAVRLVWSHNSSPQLEVRSAVISGEVALALLSAEHIAIARDANPQSQSEIGRSGFDAAMRDLAQWCPKPFVATTPSRIQTPEPTQIVDPRPLEQKPVSP